MKILSNRILSILLTAVLIFGMLSAAPLTADAATVYSVAGTCGKVNEEAVHWYAFNDRSMVFFGRGAMKDYALDKTGFSTAPWFSADLSVVANTIFSTKIVVESGITTVGDYAFYLHAQYSSYVDNFMTISTIDLSDTVTYIGKYAFYNQLIENINIPPSVTHIGANAFSGCSNLSFINYFGNPGTLTWDRGSEAQFAGGSMTCHILSTYSDQVSAFNADFSDIGLTFVADLENPYENAGEELGIDRNIALYYGATSTDVFAGAVPYIVVGTFDGNKKSTTYGSRGFVSCVEIGGSYYLLTDTNGTLKEVEYTDSDRPNGRASYCGSVYGGLSLKLRHEYIGNNIVKIIYSLKNKTDNPVSGVKLGGSGDIKIGADDRAAIAPLKNDENTQVGFYMTSSDAYDKDSHNEFATLGFIADNINIDLQGTATYPNAKYFYGAVGTNLSNAAAGVKDAKVYPQRIFEGNGAASHTTDGIASGTDTGMSYYWDNISLAANESKEYAVLFSVYGNNSDGKAMVNDLTATYHTVTWENYDNSVLQKQVVKDNTSPVYSGLTPTKPMDHEHYYEVCGWSSDGGTTEYGVYEPLPEVSADITYIAQYANIGRPFFVKHSLSLEGDIGVNFYVDVATIGADWTVTEDGDTGVISNNHTVKLDFKWYNKHTTYTLEPTDYDKSQKLFKATCRVAAAEMMYPITVTVYADNSTKALTDHRFTERYRVRDYADVILDTTSPLTATYRTEHPDDYARLVTLTKTMLDYGAKAQVVFDRYRDKDGTPIELANNDVSYTMSPYIIDVELPDMETTSNGQLSDYGLTYYGASIVFLSKTTLRQYYKVTNRTAFEQMVNDTGFQYKVNGSYIYIDQENIAAADLDKEWDFVIGDQTYKCSAMQIGRKMQEADRYGEHDLATAMYHYNVAADAFFQ